MEKIKIPHSDLEVSRLAMGCMGLGGGFDIQTKLRQSTSRRRAHSSMPPKKSASISSIMPTFMAAGDLKKSSDECCGKGHRLETEYVLQSKCGIRWEDDPPGTPQRFDFSRDHILESVNAILSRLGTDRLEILLLHRPDCLWEGEEIAAAFEKLRSSGKVLYFGV